jgi:hypothetical protein
MAEESESRIASHHEYRISLADNSNQAAAKQSLKCPIVPLKKSQHSKVIVYSQKALESNGWVARLMLA